MEQFNKINSKMYYAIKHFSKQFEYNPKIEHGDKLRKHHKFIVAGMGGSHLAAGLLKIWKPELNLIIHKDYGLPVIAEEELKNRLIILSSYSGNTEEVVDGYEKAKEKKLFMAVISKGGKLIELAKQDSVPYIQLPDTGIQPRSALGFSAKALLKIIGEENGLEEISELASALNPSNYENEGKELAGRLKGYIPVIYSSAQNLYIAYNWKIKFNETGKIPAFYNVFSELNHNEMAGFDAKESIRELTDRFYFIVLKDFQDNPRILKRMEVLEKLYKKRGLPVKVLELKGENAWRKIFSSLVLADWAAYYMAEQYGLEPEQVPIVEEFKKLIK